MLIKSKQTKINPGRKKSLIFGFIIFIGLIIIFELIITLGGLFYFYAYPFFETSITPLDTNKEEFRILYIGESTVEGIGAGGIVNSFANQTDKMLKDKYPGVKIKFVIPTSIIAATTDVLNYNLKKHLKNNNPDLVIIMAGNNDAPANTDLPTKRPIYYLKSYLFLDTFFNLKQFRRSPYRHYPMYHTLANLDEMVKKIEDYNSEAWLMGYLQEDPGTYLNPLIEQIAEENNITYVGDYPTINTIYNNSLFSPDGWHVNREGYTIIAEDLFNKMVEQKVIDKWLDKKKN